MFSQLQPQLVAVEQQIGVALFDRNGSPKLSAAGHAHVKAALASIDEGIAKAHGA